MLDYGYARVSTARQDLTRQLARLHEAGIPDERIYVDKRSGATIDRDGILVVLPMLQPGNRLTVLTLDRLARNLRDTLNVVHELTERDVFLRSLADPIPVDTSDDSFIAQMSRSFLALMAEWERIWMLERVASARAVGRHPGRPRSISPERLAAARQLLDQDPPPSIRWIAQTMGVPNSTLARALAEPREI